MGFGPFLLFCMMSSFCSYLLEVSFVPTGGSKDRKQNAQNMQQDEDYEDCMPVLRPLNFRWLASNLILPNLYHGKMGVSPNIHPLINCSGGSRLLHTLRHVSSYCQRMMKLNPGVSVFTSKTRISEGDRILLVLGNVSHEKKTGSPFYPINPSYI